MSYSKSGGVSRLKCDLCPENDASIRSSMHTTADFLRRDAKTRSNWRRDKLNRDVCPRHPTLTPQKDKEK
jgi:hypothetical protein